MDKELLGTVDCGNFLGITKHGVIKAIRRGSLPAVKIGRDWIIKQSDAEHYKKYNKGKVGRKKKIYEKTLFD